MPIEASALFISQEGPIMPDNTGERITSDWLANYEAAYAALRAGRFGREAEEIINLVFDHRNSNERLAAVVAYLSTLVGDEVAAAEATADAERERCAEHAFTVPKDRRRAEAIVERPYEALELGPE